MPKKKTPNELRIRNSTTEFLIFAYQSGGDGVEVRVQDGTIWLSQKNMSALFETSTDNIGLHLKNIFKEGELNADAVTEEFSVTASDGKKYVVKHYDLDAIIAVGYRVNSKRATAFRQWATGVLRDYTLRGYVMDRKRMENGAFLDDDYFERLLEEIREIRMSERRFYQKVADIYATALDYDKDSPITREFFAKVQNKMHYAVHGHTAAELIYKRVGADKEHMGLTNWANSPKGKIVKSDVGVAKNYLTESELDDLGRIVNAYLDLAESRAKRKVPMTMEDWANRLDIFLSADDREVLRDAGKITAKIAKEHAESEFEKYRVIQDRLFQSDFDRFVELEQQTDGKSTKMEKDALGESE
ncbi:virulence RhuM family protein [Synergistaceae bacterium OttesenSCG-928-I11]|nr:virulence RhuM family protein [Synergistaceae bacterium OttesenSCG-928-I11]